jgi:hypothetical protein
MKYALICSGVLSGIVYFADVRAGRNADFTLIVALGLCLGLAHAIDQLEEIQEWLNEDTDDEDHV